MSKRRIRLARWWLLPSRLLSLAVFFLLAARALAEEAPFSLTIDSPQASKGQKGVAKIQIRPGRGFHMNKDYPTTITVTPPVGVQVEKPKQTVKDAVRFEESGAEFNLAYAAAAIGKQTIAGECKFAVCDANSCYPKREKLNIAIDVH